MFVQVCRVLIIVVSQKEGGHVIQGTSSQQQALKETRTIMYIRHQYGSMLCIRHQCGCTSCINMARCWCIHGSKMCIRQDSVWFYCVSGIKMAHTSVYRRVKRVHTTFQRLPAFGYTHLRTNQIWNNKAINYFSVLLSPSSFRVPLHPRFLTGTWLFWALYLLSV